MTAMHTRAIAASLVVAGVALAASAQRNGGMRSGGGGFATHSAPAFHGNFAPTGRTGFMGSPQLGTLTPSFNANRRPFASQALGNQNRRFGDNRGLRDRDDFFRRPFYGGGLPYGAGWIGPSYLDYPGLGFYDDPAYATPQPAAAPQPAQYYNAQPPVEQAEAPPPPSYRPAYAEPSQPAPEPTPLAATTLVYKDGRPNEQIHNYMLTRTTLYAQEPHRREIPVDQLDLAATQKLNQDAGVDFDLPGASR